ncbi:LysR substrate-binding domain-containing protein [Terrabacter aeriphilus]|uniref:LysR substrate-binding domain-containing protein n=1 Tax=Terrabacter aeriphilus TaxID=515662 RepID=A0ABP9JJY9_9MICO
MDTRHLEYFVAVAEELSFTRAAERLHAVQSTVSSGVAVLEREVGTSLFIRSTRHIALTRTGSELLPQARAALEAVEQMRRAGARAAGTVSGSLRVGMLTNLESLGLPAAFGDFHREHPGVELSMRTSPRGSTGLVDDVRRSRLDVAFCGLPLEDLAGVHAQVLRRQPFVAVLPAGHALAGATELRLADLLDDDFVEMPAGFGNRKVVDDWLRGAGLRRRVTLEVPDLSTVPAYVAAGLGVAVVPQQTATQTMAPSAGRLVVVPLAETLVWELTVIARREGRSPAVDALLGHLAAHLPASS